MATAAPETLAARARSVMHPAQLTSSGLLITTRAPRFCNDARTSSATFQVIVCLWHAAQRRHARGLAGLEAAAAIVHQPAHLRGAAAALVAGSRKTVLPRSLVPMSAGAAAGAADAETGTTAMAGVSTAPNRATVTAVAQMHFLIVIDPRG